MRLNLPLGLSACVRSTLPPQVQTVGPLQATAPALMMSVSGGINVFELLFVVDTRECSLWLLPTFDLLGVEHAQKWQCVVLLPGVTLCRKQKIRTIIAALCDLPYIRPCTIRNMGHIDRLTSEWTLYSHGIGTCATIWGISFG